MSEATTGNHCPLCRSADFYWDELRQVYHCPTCSPDALDNDGDDPNWQEYEDDWEDCPRCDGTGYVEEELGRCRACGAT